MILCFGGGGGFQEDFPGMQLPVRALYDTFENTGQGL